MHMSKILTMTAMMSCLMAAPITVVAAPVTVKLGIGQPEGSFMYNSHVKFKEVLEAESNGRYLVNIFHSEQMGGDREMIEATQLGNLTATSVSSSPVAAFNKDYFVLDMPFMFQDRETAYKTLDGKLGQTLLDSLDKFDLKAMVFYENGFRHVTNSRRPIRTPDDVKGLKLRTMQNAIHLAAWKALGANPTPMAFGEVFVALQQKTIDGQENPPMQIWDNKFYEVQPYMTKTNHIYTPLILLINKDFYDGLPEDDRKLFISAAEQMREYNRSEAVKLANETEANLTKTGMIEILELTPEQHAMFREKASAVRPMIEERLSPEVLKLFKEYMDQ